ncbi:MAG: 4-(cytidine 5'-diphospho)-2-C-methyl-D-erythritol kinase [Aphanocapsa sp. GSE-SYN-MK-11-07L]|jgi:4-diphosphocytidyl-2-C-methyl-D-erythritol kinase|nr:4-(cytidine 5'-diphospho)-2-C-methyl-D-erythritol kinase [Aphanocapsa sp. GSE-SYN-MK-11-07L]
MSRSTYKLLAPAKINLLLQIVGDQFDDNGRSNGYHELVMIMQSISLADQIHLRSLGVDRIQLHCDHPQVPLDSSNLAHRAAALMMQKFPGLSGVEITIHKQIPIGAGLAGGSADAAAVLVGLDLMWNLGLTQTELQSLGGQLGSDVPFCLEGGTALALGRGDQLDFLPGLENIYVVLGKYRSLSVSTPWAYQTYRQQFQASYAKTPAEQDARRHASGSGSLLKAIAQRDIAQIGQRLTNDLERVVLPAHPQVAVLRQTLQAQNLLGVMMSGSGPTVFGLAESAATADQAKARVRAAIADPDLELWVAQFCSHGIRLL